MMMHKHNQNNKRTTRKQFDWFSEQGQMRMAFLLGLAKRQSKANRFQAKNMLFSLTLLAFQHSDRSIKQASSQITRCIFTGKTAKPCFHTSSYTVLADETNHKD